MTPFEDGRKEPLENTNTSRGIPPIFAVNVRLLNSFLTRSFCEGVMMLSEVRASDYAVALRSTKVFVYTLESTNCKRFRKIIQISVSSVNRHQEPNYYGAVLKNSKLNNCIPQP
ncbi:hypothetical protein PGT21_035186 [Puccinia graminis f. sp. tritici]|uniref:Uncharacterized protein n=1 Tax=Puccinia graminis f. sp. tritici TaxID=56615 RepID=A0A5B0QCN1_PUCGR|nr:hypothetical protein PGT21_035186 [Puccinia graminis f. sp. tritici]